MGNKFTSIFRWSSIAILFCTAIAKLISASGDQGVLNTIDPIIHLEVRHLLVFVAVIEILFVFVAVADWKRWLTCLGVSMLGAQFLLYHVIFGLGQYNRGCPCLGTIAQRLHVSQVNVDKIMILFAAWLFVGGFIAFILLRKSHSRITS